jgi:integrase
MASLIHEKNGTHRILFVGPDKRRRTLRLSKMPKKAAQSLLVKVEHLIGYQISKSPVDQETSAWLSSIGDELHQRLSKVGLVKPKETKRTSGMLKPLGEFLEEYKERRQEVKPASRIVWGLVIRDLKEFLPGKAIAEVTPADALDFKASMIARKLAAATINKRLSHCRMFFADAVERELISKNPFQRVKMAAPIDLGTRHFLDRSTFERILGACDPTWRTILALCRLGGLRCPSEVLSLRWQDIDWGAGKMLVHSPKTEHHANKSTREVPIYPELRPFLDEADVLAREGTVYVVENGYRAGSNSPSGWIGVNLRTQFCRILKRVGIKPWPKLFHSMRSSRETELVTENPLHVVAAWQGHSPAIASKHYLLVRESDFDRASGKLPSSSGERNLGRSLPEKLAQNAAQSMSETVRQGVQWNMTAHKKTPAIPGLTNNDVGGQTNRVEVLGFEPRQTESESVVLPLHHTSAETAAGILPEYLL